MSNRLLSSIPALIFVGATMPPLAAQAHPTGPEKRPFTERTVRIQGKVMDCVLTIIYPKPDDIVDWTQNNYYDVTNNYPVPLLLDYEYRGHFWQGVFGSVTLEIKIIARKPDLPPWKDLDSLLTGIRIKTKERNEKANKSNELGKKLHPQSHRDQEWLDPLLSQVNGVPCIQQNVRGNFTKDAKDECYYTFLFEEDFALQVGIRLADNSDRPGFWGGGSKLTSSDWRPRAEGFAKRLLSAVKVRVESKTFQRKN
jgi:hypothetical protein